MSRLLCIGGACDGEWHFVPDALIEQGARVRVAERLGPYAKPDALRKIHEYDVEEFREGDRRYHVLIEPDLKGRVFERLITRYRHRP